MAALEESKWWLIKLESSIMEREGRSTVTNKPKEADTETNSLPNKLHTRNRRRGYGQKVCSQKEMRKSGYHLPHGHGIRT